jgi:hypothetical protein
VQQGAARSEDEDQATGRRDGEDPGGECGDVTEAVAADGVKERGQQRRRVERVDSGDREDEQDQQHAAASFSGSLG